MRVVIVVLDGSWLELVAFFILVCGLCTVCQGLFALPFGIIGRL